ncbi:tetratricopeptide repeat protein [Rhodobacteraceae bacterium NNCM2]|nr:tetratricopeptide repeat protein [Coraliihabitans acroporae]
MSRIFGLTGRGPVHRAPIIWMALVVLAGCNNYPDPFAELKVQEREVGADAEASIQQGRRALRFKDYDQARKYFIASINQGGVTPEALTGIGLAEEGFGHLGEAERFHRMALRLAPDSIVAHNNLGVALFRAGEYHQAKQAFQAAFAISSGRNTVAEHNLRLAELAVAQADANAVAVIEAHSLQRMGTSEYLLHKTAVRHTEPAEKNTE